MTPAVQRWALRAALVSVALGATPALGLPADGEIAPSATLEDADGKTTDTRAFLGKPLLIVYEDRDSAKQNKPLKDELARRARALGYDGRIAIAAVADVSSWNFPPAKPFVRAAIREESRKAGTTIYCDWTGGFRTAYRMVAGTSNVVLLTRDGHVAFAASGPLDAAARERFLQRLDDVL